MSDDFQCINVIFAKINIKISYANVISGHFKGKPI